MRSDPATIYPHRSPERAITHMRQRRTDTLLCVDEQNRLLGIVSAYDLQGEARRIQSVGEMLHPAEPVLPLSATAKDALVRIAESRFGVIPVVDDHGKLSGVVTRGSLISVLAGRWKEDKAEVGS